MPSVIYKICRQTEWDEARIRGAYTGSADDLRDGFIHLSTAEQVPDTLAKFFAGQPDLVIVAVDPGSVADRLRWESSSSGKVYPHVYGLLPVSAARAVVALPVGSDGRHVLPEDIAKC